MVGERARAGGQGEPREQMPTLESEIQRATAVRKRGIGRGRALSARRPDVFRVFRTVRRRRVRSRVTVRTPIPHRVRRSMARVQIDSVSNVSTPGGREMSASS